VFNGIVNESAVYSGYLATGSRSWNSASGIKTLKNSSTVAGPPVRKGAAYPACNIKLESP
jgi:hypothetical protein